MIHKRIRCSLYKKYVYQCISTYIKMYVKNNISNISIQKVYFSGGERWDSRSHRWNHISWRATNQRGSCKAIIWTSLDDHDDHHLDIIPWHLNFTFGDNECELCTKGSFFNHCMFTGKHLCGVKECVYLLEWLIAMGGCWKWWDCHRINYKSLEELVKGGFQSYISISKLELYCHNHLFSEWQKNKSFGCFGSQLYVIVPRSGPIFWYLKW